MRYQHEFHRCKLAYDVRGSGPPVVFIQGVAMHGSASELQVNGLDSQYQCLWFDNRGIGESLPIGRVLTIERMAEDVLELMDVQQWPSAHIVGHSMGGMIAQYVALLAKQRVRSLSLLCTFADGSDAMKSSFGMIWAGVKITIGAKAKRRKAFLELMLPPRVLEHADTEKLAEEWAPIIGHDLADGPPIVAAQFVALEACDTRKRLVELQDIPTLVVSGAYDEISTPETGQKLAEGISRARFIEIAESSHGLPIQHAGLVNGLLADHFKDAEKR